MSEAKWTARQIPDLSEKTFIVTGGNSGLGLETARELARNRARVVIACRHAGKAEAAVSELEKSVPGATVSAAELDLAHLDSVRAFAEKFRSEHDRLHGLCNNAGVMALPPRTTADGFEMQFGTNHLGHFALTAQLIGLLAATPESRVVTVSSTAHVPGRMRWDDLQHKKSYQKWLVYSQSKLANLLFAFELSRRLEAARSTTRSLACHPGYASTNLQRTGPQMAGSGFMERVMDLANAVFAQDAPMGALPTLFAATSPEARTGDYIGPDQFFSTRGHPVRVSPTQRAENVVDADRLWSISESLTGVKFDIPM